MKPIPELSIEDQPEDVITTACLWAEARGEGYVGMLAVLWVISNLSKAKMRTFKEVILHPWRFSSFNNNDPNRPKLLEAWVHDPRGWASAEQVLVDFKSGVTKDPTDGANHYCTNNLWNTDDIDKPHPRWFSKQEIDSGRTKMTKVIGAHTFAICA